MLTPCARSGHAPPVGIRHFTPIDAIGVEFLAHNFPIRHAWICRLLRIILARLRLPAPHVRSAGPWKGGRGNPESLGSPPEDELPRQSALGRKSGIPTDRRRKHDASTPPCNSCAAVGRQVAPWDRPRCRGDYFLSLIPPYSRDGDGDHSARQTGTTGRPASSSEPQGPESRGT